MERNEFDIFGMTCSACQSHISRAVEKLNGVTFVNVNLLQNKMTVEFDESITTDVIIKAVQDAGYDALLVQDKKSAFDKNAKNNNIENNNLKSLIISFVFLIGIMYFSMGNMMWGFYAPAWLDHIKNPVGFAFIQFLFLMPIVYLNRRYFESGFKKLFKGKPNMDTLICVGATVSIIYGIFSIFMISYARMQLSGGLTLEKIEYNLSVIETYKKCLNFESAGMILCFVSLGKLLENLSKGKTKRAIEKLTEMKPTTATLLIDGKETVVKIDEVKVNDIVIVKRGDMIPVDGEFFKGQASINESSITGESLPVYKSVGEKVYSSGMIESGYIQIRALSVGEDTSFSKVLKLVEEASNSKAPISKLTDKISGIFVPIILLISMITFIINLFISGSFELSLNFAVTVIVIACPCALGLATPVSIMVGAGKGAENGLLIKNAEIMEKVHLIKTVVFDKTGTITEGKPTVVKFEQLTKNEDLLSIIYSIENKSEHPLAKSIIEFAKSKSIKELEISDFSAVEGLGLTAKVFDKKYYIGNLNFAKELNIDYSGVESKFLECYNNAEIPLVVIEEREIVAIISIKDKIKENSKYAIQFLKKYGIRTIMLTGDNKKTAEIIAKSVGIDEVISEVKPDEKLKVIGELRVNDKDLVAMVGDGVNDAPALSSADLAISVGSASEIALESSDIVLLKNDLLDVINAINLSKKVLKTIKLGLFWAFFYNLICVLISTGIFYYPFGFKINPMIGSIAMSISSVSVVLNALTINLFKPISIKNDNLNNEIMENNDINIEENKVKTTENFDCKNEECLVSEKIFDNFNPDEDNKFIENNKENIMEFYVKDMMCIKCETHLRNAFEKAGVQVLGVNLETKKVNIETTMDFEKIVEIVKEAGYEATLD